MDNNRRRSGAGWISLFVLIISISLMLSCSLFGSIGQSPTATIPPIQSPLVTVLVVVQSPTPEATLPSTNTPEPIVTEAPTVTIPAVVPTETETVVAVPEFIEIRNLKSIGWKMINSTKCRDAKTGCWLLTTYKEQCSLTQNEYTLIDPTWENPYLVFWQNYESKGNSTFGYLEMTTDVDVGWNQIKGYNGSNFSWKEEAIDLNEYKGREILFRINFMPTFDQLSAKQVIKYNEHYWMISDIQIIPNYQP